MKFTIAVQKQEIAWPTQRKFNRKIWLEKTKELADDQRDLELSEIGIWTADTLRQIEKTVQPSNVWNIPFRYFARSLLAINNHDLKISFDKSTEIASDSDVTFLESMDEIIRNSFSQKQDLFGAETASGIIESGLDAAELNLAFHSGTDNVHFKFSKKYLKALWRVYNYGVLYLAARDCFYRALFFGWSLTRKDDKFWLLMPKDVDIVFEAKWAASSRRFSSLLSQTALHVLDIWLKSSQIPQLWFAISSGVPRFSYRSTGNLLRIKFDGREESLPKTPPKDTINEAIAREYYYESLLQEPLKKLGGRNILDLLRVQFILEIIVSEIQDRLPKEVKKTTVHSLSRYCPIIQKDSLVNSIAEALDIDKEIISKIIEVFCWKKEKNDSLWFHPFIPVSTNKGTGLMVAAVPIIAGNIYRSIDYWLSEFGLPLKRRGQLFEEQIISESQIAIAEAGLEKRVFVYGPLKLTASDKSSEEEIDILFLLDDMIVIGEAKCQKFPATYLEQFNYQNTLREGALQALRKTEWVKQNLNVVAELFEVEIGFLSGKVVPIIISNHAIGVGVSFEGVPVLDMRLITNYFSRPYKRLSTFSGHGMKDYKGTPFYDDIQEMVKKFENYIENPPFIETYTNALKPKLIYFPLREDGKFLMLDFVVDETLLIQNNYFS